MVCYYDFILNNDNGGIMNRSVFPLEVLKGIGKMRISIYGTCLMNQKQYKPGAWLIQIKDAGHQLMSQYPDEINRVLQTFLSTTRNPG